MRLSLGWWPTSRYHVPRSFLKTFGNLLVLFEEMGGDPLSITVNTISVAHICGNVAESFSPSPFSKRTQPSVQLQCHEGEAISSIKFASYGNPIGDCENYALGSCHAVSSKAVIEKVTSSTFSIYKHAHRHKILTWCTGSTIQSSSLRERRVVETFSVLSISLEKERVLEIPRLLSMFFPNKIRYIIRINKNKVSKKINNIFS